MFVNDAVLQSCYDDLGDMQVSCPHKEEFYILFDQFGAFQNFPIPFCLLFLHVAFSANMKKVTV